MLLWPGLCLCFHNARSYTLEFCSSCIMIILPRVISLKTLLLWPTFYWIVVAVKFLMLDVYLCFCKYKSVCPSPILCQNIHQLESLAGTIGLDMLASSRILKKLSWKFSSKSVYKFLFKNTVEHLLMDTSPASQLPPHGLRQAKRCHHVQTQLAFYVNLHRAVIGRQLPWWTDGGPI